MNRWCDAWVNAWYLVGANYMMDVLEMMDAQGGK